MRRGPGRCWVVHPSRGSFPAGDSGGCWPCWWAWPRRGIRMLTALPARRSGAGQPDECEEGVVDLAGVGPDDRVRAVRYHHMPGSAQQTRQPVSGGLGGQDAVLTALDDQDGDINPREVAAEVFQRGDDVAAGGGRGCAEGRLEAVLPCLVADVAAAEEVDVVGLVEEGLGRGGPVGGDLGQELLDHAAVNAVRVAGRLEQVGWQRSDQRGGADRVPVQKPTSVTSCRLSSESSTSRSAARVSKSYPTLGLLELPKPRRS